MTTRRPVWPAAARRGLAGLLFGLAATVGRADAGDEAPAIDPAPAMIERILLARPPKDCSLKARLLVTRDKAVAVDVLIKHLPDETRTIYRSGTTEVLVIQPLRGAPRFFLKGKGELTGAARTEKLLASWFTFYDLGLPFLQWPGPKSAGEDRQRGRTCKLVTIAAPGEPGAEPYARVQVWLDREYTAPLRVDAYNADGLVVRRFVVTSFKRIGEVWVPRGTELAFVPPGQSLPAEEKSRLEIYDGSYDANLPAEWFDSAQFQAP